MYIHLTEIYNRESILKSGIIPSKIKLPQHLKFFKKYDYCTEDGKMIYLWSDCLSNERFIKDMIYIKVFGHARNDYYNVMEKAFDDGSAYPKGIKYYEDYYKDKFNMRKLGTSPIYKYDQMVFDVYLIETSADVKFGGIHSQFPSDNIYNSLHLMDERYAHNDKELYVSKKPLKIKIIGQAKYYYDNKKINIEVIR